MIRGRKSICSSTLRVWFNPTLLVVGIGGTFLFCSWALCRRVIELTDHFQQKLPAWFVIPLWFSVVSIILLWIAILCAAGIYAEFSESGIRLCRCFRKAVEKPYKHYPYLQKAWHVYYGMNVYYIVLGNRRLSTDERMHINQVEFTPDMLKLRYNK